MAEANKDPYAVDGGNPGNPQPEPAQTAQVGTVEMSQKIPERFTGSSYEELIPQLEKRMKSFEPMSEEELKKLRRRQKAEGIISGISDAAMSVANLWATSRYAPDMYDGSKSMAARAKERFDREKAEREKDEEKWLNYALTIGKLKDADAERGLKGWQAEQTLARQDRQYDASRQDRREDVEYRDKSWDEQVRQWHANFDRQGKWHDEDGAFREKQFNQSVRQFNVQTSLEKQRIGMEAQRLAQQVKQGQMTFNLGSGHGNVTLSLDKLNAQTVSRIYATLPDSALYHEKTDKEGNPVKDTKGFPVYDRNKPKVQGDPIVQNGLVVGYKPPTTEAMLIAIGANVETSPATQNAIRQVAGLEKGVKPKAY